LLEKSKLRRHRRTRQLKFLARYSAPRASASRLRSKYCGRCSDGASVIFCRPPKGVPRKLARRAWGIASSTRLHRFSSTDRPPQDRHDAFRSETFAAAMSEEGRITSSPSLSQCEREMKGRQCRRKRQRVLRAGYWAIADFEASICGRCLGAAAADWRTAVGFPSSVISPVPKE